MVLKFQYSFFKQSFKKNILVKYSMINKCKIDTTLYYSVQVL